MNLCSCSPSRACLWSGYWLTVCPCGWGCNCTSSSGTRRRRAFEEDEVKEVNEAKEIRDSERGESGCSGDRNGSEKSCGAFERGHGLLREHRDCAREPRRFKHALAARQLPPAHTAARAALGRWHCDFLLMPRSA